MRANFALDYDVLTVEQSQKLYLMAYLTAAPAPTDHQRRPLNISLVIDRSGSMAGDKNEYTSQAAQLLVQNLGAHDLLSIVLYNENVETLLMPEPVQRKDVINQQIGTIKPGGTTNLSGGWLQGCGLVKQNLNGQYLNRVILMTDGLANRGITDSAKLVSLAGQKREEGISTTTMGLGIDFNEELLMEMANTGGGAFYFIESPEVTPTIFQEELQGLLSVVGQNLTITIDPTDHITEIRQLNSYLTEYDGRRTLFRLGDVFGNEVKAILLELTIPAITTLGQQQIATLRFDYDEINEQGVQHQTLEMPVNINVAQQEIVIAANANIEVQRSVLLLQSARARRDAIEAADRRDFKSAAEFLYNAAAAIDTAGLDDAKLAEERDALTKQAQDLEKGAAHYDQYSRKLMSTQSFYTLSNRHDDTVILRMRDQKRDDQTIDTGDSDPDADPQPQIMPPPNVGLFSQQLRKNQNIPTHLQWHGHLFPLKTDLIRVGRARENDIVIPVKGVSRYHAEITREGDRLWITDKGSTNGTTVNGKQITGAYPVYVGDEVLICEERLIFMEAQA